MTLVKAWCIAISSGVLLSACGGGSGGSGSSDPGGDTGPEFITKAELGERLFSDTNLSFDRNQSCATCHNPAHAFIDSRRDSDGNIVAVSIGDDGVSLGDRNTPTIAYARFTPEFTQESHARFNSQQSDYDGFVGGQFLDGRALDLQAQAAAPILNPVEMAMPDEASVVARLQENTDYVESFEFIYGANIFDSVDSAYDAMTDSIAEFERTEVFNSFDSKYDRSLRGEYTYDPLSKAALGKSLFFSQQFTNCATCHQLRPNGNTDEMFSNFEYHNIGVPVNTDVRLANGAIDGFVDGGLLDNPDITDQSQRGKFKVPSLRNVAVTAPYMHNGVFRELKTVVEFYDHFLTNSEHLINPETGVEWAEPEVSETVAFTELQDGTRMDQQDVEGMVCFLRTLTDARFESLIPDDGIDCGE